MGFGGILASIANGLGGGMIKVADEGWKKEAEDRKYQFYADQKALDREFELTKMDKEHQYDVDLFRKKTAISQAVANAANNNPKMNDIDKVNDAFRAIEGLTQGIAELDEKLADGNLSKEQKIALTQQRQELIEHRTRIANNKNMWGKVKNGDYGEQLRATHAMNVGVFETPPKTETPQATKTVMEVPRPSAIEVQKPAASLSTSSYAAMSYAKPSMTKQQLIAVENEKRRQQALNHFNANYPLLSK